MATETVKLRVPVEIGSETVSELVLRPTSRAFRDVEVKVGSDGSMTYKPYALAVVGVKLAGRPAADVFVDKMHPADMTELSGVVLGFLGGDPTTGSEPSP